MIPQPIRGITVCVNYDDLLEITLVRNMRHLAECVVVTSPNDEKTKAVCARVPNVRVFETDAFYRYGAKFNKGLAIEEGFDFLGREGWILIFDADTLFPDSMPISLKKGRLYGAPRKILPDPKQWAPEYNWKSANLSNDKSFPGYFQLFNANDPVITKRPWYDVTFTHAGGCDGYFESRWLSENKVRLPFHVLHLGPRDSNWFGRASVRTDRAEIANWRQSNLDMQQFLEFKGWKGNKVRQVTQFEEHVEVPGYEQSGYKLKGKFD